MKLNAIARSLAVASVLAIGAAATVTIASSSSALVAEATNRYFVIFDEAGALHYEGGLPGLPRTAATADGVVFDSTRQEVVDYRAHLSDSRQQHIAAIASVLGRGVQPTFHYDILYNGIVIPDLTAAEAALLAAQPGVKEVAVVEDFELSTDRVSQFIGAGSIWDGSATPGNVPARGEGQVVAVIDTGLTSSHATHGSFRNDPACGFDASTPKVIAAKDCFGTNCTGPTPYSTGNPHGTHVAATVLGNVHVATGGDLAGTEVGGVAPCARLISYKVCLTNTCSGDALAAAFNTVLADAVPHGVTAVNFSISGGTSPWSTSDSNRSFLDMVNAGIFVAASAGNTSTTVPNPIGQVNHRGPWVTTVANSTHDRVSSNNVSLDQGGPQNMYGLKGQMVIPSDRTGQVADSAAQGNLLGCTAFTAGSMTGKIALIQRGECNFSVKLANAATAGAIGAVIYNAIPGQLPLVMGETTSSIPAVSMTNADGLAIRAHATANPTSQATISAITNVLHDPGAGDILAASSFRGPIGGGIEVTKPDITAPGTDIFAAYDAGVNSYNYMSGTSMSGPHIAGSGALLRSVHPTWTPPEVKSAIMLTAKKEGFKDFTNGNPNSGPWDADDVGNGRVDLTKAALTGLVMNETNANFLAAQGNVGNQRALNIASMRNTACTPSCTWTRTFRNTLSTPSSWSATGANLGPGLTVSVTPATFSFTGGLSETQTLTITATPNGNQTSAVVFGEVNLVEAADQSPDLHLTVAIRGQGAGGPPAIQVNPTTISATGQAGSSSAVIRPLTINNAGGSDLTWSEGTLVVNERGSPSVVWDQPVSGTQGIVSDFSTTQNGGAWSAGDFALTSDTDLTQIVAYGFDNTGSLAAQPSVSWAIYPDASGQPAGNPGTNPGAAVWTYTSPMNGAGVSLGGAGGEIGLNLVAAGQSVNLSQGTYWLVVWPTYNNNITQAGDPRWNWYQAAVQGSPGLLISPLFGVASWSPIGGLTGGAIEEVAFTLTGVQGSTECGAPWLSINPTSGTVGAGQSQGVSVLLNASSLAAGTYNANLCIDSNDANNPTVVVPVSFTVEEGGPPADSSDLSLSAIGLPATVGQGDEVRFIVNVANFGPDAANEVEVEFALPPELGYSAVVTSYSAAKSSASSPAQQARGTAWNCADNTATVVCVLSGPLASPGLAPTLELITTVAPSADPGTVSTDITVSSVNADPVPGNNSKSLDTEIVGVPDAIFANGFECAEGYPDCSTVDPDLVDSGPVNLVIEVDQQLNLVTGQFGDYGSFSGADINLYDWYGGTEPTADLYVWFLNDETAGQGGVLDGSGQFAVLGSGATVGPSSNISDANIQMANWLTGTTGYLGIRFFDESAGDFRYGYLELQTGSNGGMPVTIKRYVYNSAGNAVTIP